MHQDVHPERRQKPLPIPVVCQELNEVEARMEAELKLGRERMDRIETKLDTNCTDTSEILDILRLGKSFFRIIGYAGNFLKWATAIAAPVLVFWYTIKNGGKL